MRRSTLIWLLYFLNLCNGIAQTNAFHTNLIPNPSFEQANTCDKYAELCCPEAWRSTTLKLFYYLNDLNSKNSVNIPVDGHRMISLCLHDSRIPKNRAFVQVPLLCPLVADASYRLSFFYKAKEQHIGKFGIRFSEKMKISTNNAEYLDQSPDLEIILPPDLKADVWIKVEQTFIAAGDEKVMILGNFTPEDSIKIHPFVIPKKKKRDSYEPASRTYYVFDQFELSPIDSSITCEAYGQCQLIFDDNVRHSIPKFPELYARKKEMTSTDSLPIALPASEPIIIENLANELDTFQVAEAFEMSDIRFTSGKAELLASSLPAMRLLAQLLNENPSLKLEITGHTDNVGNEIFNQKLSEERAAVIKLFLVKEGIANNRVIASGKGAKVPIADNSTIEGKAMNRRVEFKLIQIK